jgi:hypothetical protein
MNKITITSRGMVIILFFLLVPFAFAQVLPKDPARGGRLFVNKGV